jgi:uncharacterized protein (TIGR00730 family)
MRLPKDAPRTPRPTALPETRPRQVSSARGRARAGDGATHRAVRSGGLLARAGDDKPTGALARARAQAPKASQIAKTYSMAPDALVALLGGEIEKAFAFAETLSPAITAFGGARVKPDSAAFEVGKRWGEAILLANLYAHAPELAAQALLSGAFTQRATRAAAQVALGVCAGSATPALLGTMLGAVGAAASPEGQAMAAQLASLASARSDDVRAAQAAVIRSGAGPGMMEAVAIGYVEARKQLEALVGPLPAEVAKNLETQGSRILLPFEQETSPFIEKLENFVHFLPRRLALTERASGFVVFPGGFGTLNEVFEVMRSGRPVLFEDSKFYGETIDALKTAWGARGLVPPERLALFEVADGVDEGLPKLVANTVGAPAQAEPSKARADEMSADLVRGMETLAELPTAVTVFGGSALAADDVAVKVAERLSERLARTKVGVRAGGDGAILDAVARGVKRGDADGVVQAVLFDRGQPGLEAVRAKAEVFEVVHSAPVHKVLLYENTDAFVVLPGGVGTFDELWEIACLMQTGKTPKRPIVLVDDTFWTPILDAMHRAMALGPDKTIAADDMRLFTVVKTSPGPVPAGERPYTITNEGGALACIHRHREARLAEVS